MEKGPGGMVQWIKPYSAKQDNLNLMQDSQGERGVPAPKSYPLASTGVHTQQQTNVRKKSGVFFLKKKTTCEL